ncbi:MAG: hypothetical protein VSS75_011255, partial [Candidatus Parabeggiatoa sp.]|nr:hypothetical protein [Candidatus Parabeggiatoa sp.]
MANEWRVKKNNARDARDPREAKDRYLLRPLTPPLAPLASFAFIFLFLVTAKIKSIDRIPHVAI